MEKELKKLKDSSRKDILDYLKRMDKNPSSKTSMVDLTKFCLDNYIDEDPKNMKYFLKKIADDRAAVLTGYNQLGVSFASSPKRLADVSIHGKLLQAGSEELMA